MNRLPGGQHGNLASAGCVLPIAAARLFDDENLSARDDRAPTGFGIGVRRQRVTHCLFAGAFALAADGDPIVNGVSLPTASGGSRRGETARRCRSRDGSLVFIQHDAATGRVDLQVYGVRNREHCVRPRYDLNHVIAIGLDYQTRRAEPVHGLRRLISERQRRTHAEKTDGQNLYAERGTVDDLYLNALTGACAETIAINELIAAHARLPV